MAVAEGLAAAGLVLISYPLHPRGSPRNRGPLISGAHCSLPVRVRDPDAFGTREELEAATAAIPGAVTHVWIEGGDHGLKGKDEQVVAAVRSWIGQLNQG